MMGHSVDETLGRKIWHHDIEGCIERLGQGPLQAKASDDHCIDQLWRQGWICTCYTQNALKRS